MQRRIFTQRFAGALALMSSFGASVPAFNRKLLKAARLKPGDAVYLIAPGSPIGEDRLQRSVENLEKLGLRPRPGKHVLAEKGYIAGSDAERLEDLHAAFSDRECTAVWCIRGGYGCSRLLPSIDYKLIRNNPRALIGYSDITALHQAIHLQTGLVTFHGPVGASELSAYTEAQVSTTLMDGPARQVIPLATEQITEADPLFRPYVIRPGRARGPLVGGNLSLLAALAGTRHGMDATGKLVFMEDVGEDPYRVDRMLTQLRQASNLGKARGILLGVFSGCEADPDAKSLSLKETLTDRLGDLGIPVLYGHSFGHILNMCTLPVGIQATLETGSMTLTLEEAAVRD